MTSQKLQLARGWFALFAASLIASMAVSVLAAPRAEHVTQGKRATALAVIPGRAMGTAFCIDSDGYFIAHDSLVQELGDQTVTLILEPGEAGQRALEATVVRVDNEVDLALLKVKDAKGLTALKWSDKRNLVETAEVVTFGFPYAQRAALERKEYPSISVNVGRITALRKVDDRLGAILVDAAMAVSHSGGPALDSDGRALGVVCARPVRVGGAEIRNFIIPADTVQQFLAKPQIEFAPAEIPFDRRHDEVEMEVRITTFTGEKRRFDVALSLDDTRGRERIVHAKREKDRYLLRFKPIEPSEESAKLPVELTFASGSMRGQIEEAKFEIGEATASLSQVSRLERDGQEDKWRVIFKDGKQATGALKLGTIKVDLGGATVQVDAEALRSMVVYEPSGPPSELAYTLTVQHGKEEPITQRGRILIGRPPLKPVPSVGAEPHDASVPPAYVPPKGEVSFADERVKIKLSEPFNTFTVAGAGRYFVFHLKEASKLVILDVLRGRVVHEIPAVPTDVLVAGGRDKLVLVFPGQKLMQRWRLAPFEREKTAPMPAKGTAQRAMLGQDSYGPVLVIAEDAAFVDVDTLSPMAVDGPILAAQFGNAQGGVYTGVAYWNYERMRLIKSRTVADKFGTGQGEGGRWSRPTADGSLLLAKGPVIFSATGKQLDSKWLEGCTTFPTVDPRYFIAVKFAHDPKRNGAVTHLNICTAADRRIVHTLVGLEDMAPKGNTNQYNDILYRLFNGEERFHYIPWANVIVTFSWSGDIVTLERFNLITSLEQTGVDYLFVTSIPPARAYRGRTFSHGLAVTSKAGGVKYTLESGPKDLSLSPAGALRWDVPPHTAETSATVIIRVNDRAGSELFHSFELAVEDPPATVIQGTTKP